MRTLEVVILTVLIATGLQSGAFAAGKPVLSVEETVESLTGQEKIEATSGEVTTIAPTDAANGVQIGSSSSEPMKLPSASALDPRQIEDGMAVYRNPSEGYAVAVNPFDGGTQVLTVLGDSSAPTSFTYGVAGVDEEVVIGDDGSAGVVNTRTGETISVIEKPWAVDANGAEVSTRFVTDGKNLVQVVDHRSEPSAYPVTADPKIFRCDAYTHTCVKFTKAETKKISKAATEGTAATVFASVLCTVIPNVTLKAACAAAVVLVAGKLKSAFRRAAKSRKCVELHFLGAAGVLTKWKVEKC